MPVPSTLKVHCHLHEWFAWTDSAFRDEAEGGEEKEVATQPSPILNQYNEEDLQTLVCLVSYISCYVYLLCIVNATLLCFRLWKSNGALLSMIS